MIEKLARPYADVFLNVLKKRFHFFFFFFGGGGGFVYITRSGIFCATVGGHLSQ